MTHFPSSRTKSTGARRNGSRGRVRSVAVISIVCALMGALAACSSSSSKPGGHEKSGGVVTFAEPPGTIPSWILPFVDTTDYNYMNNFQWDWQMWRPAYFVGGPNTPNINYDASLAEKPVYSDNNTTVAVTVKPYNWSDGTPITARNLLFFFNILKAEKLNWWLYIPGSFPDDVASATITNTRTLTFKLTHPVNPQLFDQNDLQSLIPLPLAWDRTSMSGDHGAGSTLPSGSGQGLDMTGAGVKSVYNFLIAQNKLKSQYATSWLWKIVSGPFKLDSYSLDGTTSLVPNSSYGGTHPKINKLTFLPFTSSASEYAAVRSGNIDIGYTTYANLSQQSSLSGYKLAAWPSWAYTTTWLNYNNPKTGPIFKQLYIRQALQSLIDQPSIIKNVYHGQASPSMGPVPLDPPNQWLTPYLKSNPYPFDPSKAITLLKSHGWNVSPGSTTTCANAGSGPGQCGAGIPSGAQLSFTSLYSSALPENQTQSIVEKTDFSKAGVTLNLRPVTSDALFSDAPQCTPDQSSCSWDMMTLQNYTPFPYPYSGINAHSGGVYNEGSYSDPQTDSLLDAAAVSASPDALSASNDRITQQAIQLYLPATPYQLTEVRSNLQGVTPQNPQFAINPELWSFS